LLIDSAFVESSVFAFHPIQRSIGVSLSPSNSPIPSAAPNASFTPSKRPMFKEEGEDILDGEVTKAWEHDVVVAAAIRIDDDDFIFIVSIFFSIYWTARATISIAM